MPITYKTEKFTVESYEVSVSQSIDGLRRTVSLTSSDLSHGIRYKATLLFFKTNFSPSGVGYANNLSGANFDPRSITAWGDNTLFDSFYAILSIESPVTFEFEYKIDPAAPSDDDKYLTTYRLFSGKEAPGDFEKASKFFVFNGLQSTSTGDGQ